MNGAALTLLLVCCMLPSALADPLRSRSIVWSGAKDIWIPWSSVTDYFIDMNSDGSPDVEVFYSIKAEEVIAARTVSGSEVVWKSVSIAPLAAGVWIGSDLSSGQRWDVGTGVLAEYNNPVSEDRGPVGAGPWAGVDRGYMGVTVETDAKTYYGWVSMSVHDEYPEVYIHDWAWNTVPGAPILAGDTGFHYVSPTGSHTLPYSTWATAATNIQAAVDVAGDGHVVIITNGTYTVTNEITITNGITLQSVAGASVTMIDGGRTTRCLRLLAGAGCVVRGFSITNGLAGTNEYGGGVWMGAGNTLADCLIANCEAWAGGGVYATDAVVSNCTFLGNVAECGGFLVDGCVFTDNSADTGGGAFCGDLSNSVGAVSNLMTATLGFLDSLAGVDWYAGAYNISNVLLELASGPGTLTPPDMSSSPGRPDMMRVPYGMASWSNTIRNCTANNNTAIRGGGFFLLDSLGAAVRNCHVSGNDAQYGGGVAAARGGVLTESTVSENHAGSLGGGILVWESLDMVNCHINSNSAASVAGGCMLGFPASSFLAGGDTPLAISGLGDGSSRVLGSEFVGNDGGMLGGGLLLGNGAASSNTLFQNTALWGGGIANWGGDLAECVLVENTATIGAGILHFQGNTVRCLAEYNSAQVMGGGIAAFSLPLGGSVAAEACELRNNFAAAGGGIALVDSALARRCTITSNTAGIAGGGVFTMLGGEVQTSLIRGNAAGDGAGIYCLSGGRVVNTTVTENDALRTGGGVFVITDQNLAGGWQYDTEAVIANSIVYGNTASNAVNYMTLASNVTYSYTCTVPLAPGMGNMTNDPLLTASYRLAATSPGVDAGNNGLMPAGSDLAGIPRPLDSDNDGTPTVDMGCYEHLNPIADTDGDGMPDGWEASQSFNLLSDDAKGDPDSDGMPNIGEYVSDTAPHDANSVLSLIRIGRQFGGIRLDWKGGREAWQILECREDLVSTTEQWTAIFALPPPTALTNAVIDMGVTNAVLFYRIRAER
jgi:hypothetical protein